jgi:hypothetical protein
VYLCSCIIVDKCVVGLGDCKQAEVVEKARITDTFMDMELGV